MHHDQWNRRIRGRLHHRCLQPTHQGYLIASLHPRSSAIWYFPKPMKTDTGNPCLQSGNFPACRERTFSHPHARTAFLTDFSCDGTVCFSYSAGNIRMDKHLAMLRESNTVAISYTITNQGEEAGLSITPLMNFREHSASSAVSDLQFTCEPNTVGGFTLIPAAAPDSASSFPAVPADFFHVKTNTTWICSTRRK